MSIRVSTNDHSEPLIANGTIQMRWNQITELIGYALFLIFAGSMVNCYSAIGLYRGKIVRKEAR